MNNLNCNEIIMKVKIDKEDINKEKYFLDNTDEEYEEGDEWIDYHHDNLKELNENNTELYINNKKMKYKKYFVPEKEGIYSTILKFNISIKDCSYMFCGCSSL